MIQSFSGKLRYLAVVKEREMTKETQARNKIASFINTRSKSRHGNNLIPCILRGFWRCRRRMHLFHARWWGWWWFQWTLEIVPWLLKMRGYVSNMIIMLSCYLCKCKWYPLPTTIRSSSIYAGRFYLSAPEKCDILDLYLFSKDNSHSQSKEEYPRYWSVITWFVDNSKI